MNLFEDPIVLLLPTIPPQMADLASFSQRLPDWIEGQVCALSYFGGVPKAIVCDTLKDGGACKKSYIDNRTVVLMQVETKEGRAAACES